MFPSNVDLLDVTYCDDNIICSDSGVWTYLVVAGENFGITTYSKLEEHAEKLIQFSENGNRRTNSHKDLLLCPLIPKGG